MPYEWKPEAYLELPEHIQRARDLLEEWYWAMEEGTAILRQPDPLHPSGMTQEVADAMIELMDKGFARELRTWASNESAGGYTHAPEFARLAPLQRIALAQQLWDILAPARDARQQAEPYLD